MQKSIEIAKRLKGNLEGDWRKEIEDANLQIVFEEIYKLPNTIIHINTCIAFIIFSYDSDSGYINLKQDRYLNKVDILEGLGGNPSEEVYQLLLNVDTDDFQEVISKFIKRQPDWRFRTIVTCFDFHSKHIGTAAEPISATITDDLEKAKINKAKGELLKEAIRQREVGEQLLLQIKKDYVNLDHVTQSEFGFIATEVEKYDVQSWRSFIKRRNNLAKAQ